MEDYQFEQASDSSLKNDAELHDKNKIILLTQLSADGQIISQVKEITFEDPIAQERFRLTPSELKTMKSALLKFCDEYGKKHNSYVNGEVYELGRPSLPMLSKRFFEVAYIEKWNKWFKLDEMNVTLVDEWYAQPKFMKGVVCECYF